MTSQSFNLTTDPWIKVIQTDTGREKSVSLIEFFSHAQDYRQLAGEMRSQDLAIMRFLLAILTTVYSRYNAGNMPYSWITVDSDTMQATDVDDDTDAEDINEDLLDTWNKLYRAGKFSKIVTDYLKCYDNRFDMFGDHPFYQVTTADYDALVPSNKRVEKGKGQVLVKQLNRRISESGNTPSIFAPKTGERKNSIDIDELVRWLISYQNFTGVTDKTKIETKEKFSNSAGWLYRLNPVYAQGQTVFETLMLNLKLGGEQVDPLALQKPVWEYEIQDYIAVRKQQVVPDNLAELYTTWSRILHIEWQDNKHPLIFSAGIPIFEATGAFIEPMTTWRVDKKTGEYRPAVKSLRSLSISMWRNFGNYVDVHSNSGQLEPGIVSWLHDIKDQDTSVIANDQLLTLASTTLISDGNATSQAPAVEVADDIRLQSDVLFDPEIAEYWPVRIEDAIDTTQMIGTDFYHFASTIGQIRNVDARSFASNLSAIFYQKLNAPFKEWLSQLTGDDDRDQKIEQWKEQLEDILNDTVRDVMKSSSPRDVSGIEDDKGRLLNIFTARRRLNYNVRIHLGPQDKE